MDPIFQAHPIPQNVTNFEFHLVGDMTLKQFGYLASGLGLAFLVFTTLSTVQPIIAWPIIIISSLMGAAFAFLPIQERPLDHWVGAFFKAIFKPTTLKYSSNILKAEDPLFNKRLSHYVKTYLKSQTILPPLPLLPTKTAAAVNELGGKKKESFMDKFKAGQTSFGTPAHHLSPQAQPAPITGSPSVPQAPRSAPTNGTVKNQVVAAIPLQPPTQTTSPSPGIVRNMQVINQLPTDPQPARFRPTPLVTPSPNQPQSVQENPPIQKPAEDLKPEDLKKTVELAQDAQETQEEIVKIEASLSQIKQQAAQPGVDPKSYIEQFEDLLTNLQKLNEKASITAQELAKISKLPIAPQSLDAIQAQSAPPVKAKSIPTLKLTTFPNVINGIVTDSQGNYIEGAIVVAHDKQGLPVRALKSNKLGQFVAATPLPNGEYSIVVEKDNLSFDKVGIELNNEVLPPILVAAKKLVQGTA